MIMAITEVGRDLTGQGDKVKVDGVIVCSFWQRLKSRVIISIVYLVYIIVLQLSFYGPLCIIM